jgi:hypothetical protein
MPSRDWALNRLHLRGVRCFRDAEVQFHEKVTVVVGGNASGKTTLMEAIASLTYGDGEGLAEFPLRTGDAPGAILLFEKGRDVAAARWNSGQETRKRLPGDHYLFLYGRYRSTPAQGTRSEDRGLTDAENLDELANHAGIFRSAALTRPDKPLMDMLPGYLRGLWFGRPSDPRLDAIWQRLNRALGEIDPSLSEFRIDGQLNTAPHIIRGGLPFELEQLSDGYQAILAIVLDLMLRYAYLFYDGDPLEGNAAVCIDEIDLHLHPQWQRTILPQLTGLFPGTQFVVTTHSPIVVQSAIDRGFGVARLVEEDGAVKAQPLSTRLAKSLRGAEVGSVLLEEHLFGIESRFSVEFGGVEREVDELQEKVSRGEATKADYRALKKGIGKLEELVAKEDRRRAGGSTMSGLVRMQANFVKALAEELKRSRS